MFDDDGIVKLRENAKGTSPKPLTWDEYALVLRLLILGESPQIFTGHGVVPADDAPLVVDEDRFRTAMDEDAMGETAAAGPPSKKKARTSPNNGDVIKFFSEPASQLLRGDLTTDEKITALTKLMYLHPNAQDNEDEKKAVWYIARQIRIATILNKVRDDPDDGVRGRAAAMQVWWAAATRAR